jgi:hypothetical protein
VLYVVPPSLLARHNLSFARFTYLALITPEACDFLRRERVIASFRLYHSRATQQRRRRSGQAEKRGRKHVLLSRLLLRA